MVLYHLREEISIVLVTTLTEEITATALTSRGPVSHEDFERWARGRHWQFARTRPRNPHWYTHRAWGHEETFLRIVLHLRERGRQEVRSEEHTSELQSRQYLVCRLLLEKKK